MSANIKRRFGGRSLAAAAIAALIPRLLSAAPDIALQMCVDVFPAVSTKCAGSNVNATGPGGCFIATASFGSVLEPHVMALREFRDRYLQRSALGRAFIRFYYRYSPPVAAVIARHESLRFGVRVLLTPVVLIIEYSSWAGALLAVALVPLITRRRPTMRVASRT